MTDPQTIDELLSVQDPAAQALAAKPYIRRCEEELSAARKARDDAIRRYLENHGVTATARACGVSIALVKAIRR